MCIRFQVFKFQLFSFNRDLKKNMCRNPDGDRAPWCYTMDPRVRWEYCSVQKCRPSSEVSPTSPPRPEIPSTATQTPPERGDLFNTLNPAFELCVCALGSVSYFSVTVLDCKIGNGVTYRGPTSITTPGVTCQAWSAQTPHRHNSFTPRSHPDKGLEANVSVFVPI